MPDTTPTERLTDERLRWIASPDWVAHDESAGEEPNSWAEAARDLAAEVLELRQRVVELTLANAHAHGERVGYILGHQGDLGDWVITDPCIPWADPADAENARADAEEYTVPGVTAHVLALYREDGSR